MAKSQVLEKGSIYFIYRPKVEQETVKGMEDVQRFYIVLSPYRKDIYRLMVVGRQTMPDIGGERNWAFVQNIGRRPEDVEDELDRDVYRTKTRG